MSEIKIYVEGSTGRITLTRPEALNALSYAMCEAMEEALLAWQDDAAITQVIIDAQGERAFCAGGDIAKLYEYGLQGDFDYARKFWKDEYRLNALIANYPKPYIAFLHGFVMGGGVGIACHGSHRIVCETVKIAMPECAIGLIPDVGGTALLSRVPGKMGLYLGLTGYRMNAADSLYAGFADYLVPESSYDALKDALIKAGNTSPIEAFSSAASGESVLADWQEECDKFFASDNLAELAKAHPGHADMDKFWSKAMMHNAPLSMLCTAEILKRLNPGDDIETALELEYRFTYRSMDEGEFLEGTRAAVIDKDRNPNWQAKSMMDISDMKIESMLAEVPH